MAKLGLVSVVACYAMHIACAARFEQELEEGSDASDPLSSENLLKLRASKQKHMFTHAMDCHSRHDQHKDWPDRFRSFIKELRVAVDQSQNFSNPRTTWRPMVGGLLKYLPEELIYHTAVELVTRTDEERVTEPGMLYPDSKCFKFSYDDGSTGSDPAGCSFFKESFRDVSKTRECIVKRLDNSKKWKEYENDRPPANEAYMNETAFTGKCTWFDSNDRAEEMIKRLAKIHKGAPASKGYTLENVLTKLQLTVSIPGGKPTRGVKVKKDWPLEEETLKEIAEECFHININAAGQVAEEPAEPSQRAVDLRLKGSCMFGMWDYVEVAGAPQTPLSRAESNLDPALRESMAVSLEEYTSTPSLCGRVAALMVSQNIVQSDYSVQPSVFYHMYDLEQCALATKYNCIHFVDCWRNALKELTKFVPQCRADTVEIPFPDSSSQKPSLLGGLKTAFRKITLTPLLWAGGQLVGRPFKNLLTIGANRGRIMHYTQDKAANIISSLLPTGDNNALPMGGDNKSLPVGSTRSPNPSGRLDLKETMYRASMA